jgi:hypothetical protein
MPQIAGRVARELADGVPAFGSPAAFELDRFADAVSLGVVACAG